LAAGEVGAVLYSHQHEDRAWNRLGPFAIHQELELPSRCEVLEVRTGNSGSVLKSVHLARDLLCADPELKNILLIAADKVNHHVVRRKFGDVIWGDAAAAVVVKRTEDRFRLIGKPYSVVLPEFNTLPLFASGSEEAWSRSAAAGAADGLRAVLSDAGLKLSALDAVLTNNCSPALREAFARAANLPDNLVCAPTQCRVGTCTVTDILLNLNAFAVTARTGDTIALVSLGLGASCHVQLVVVQ
jgi:3-oxoacyl-[acyl-carrier-protein] synthase III